MKKLLFVATVIVALLSGCSKPQVKPRDISIIPKPVEMVKGKGNFFITGKTKIIYAGDNEVESVASYLKEILKTPTGFDLQMEKGNGVEKNSIILRLDNRKEFDEEGYSLEVSDNNIVITAARPSGLFYGVQTVLQLLPVEIYSPVKIKEMTWNVPAVKIYDKPLFKWRGMHLDVSRHFFPKEFIKRYIDLIAMHKMNIFHWHLTDDNGWRIEIKRYPELTDICAWRVPRDKWRGAEPPRPGEKPTYGGYYTQEDIKEIVKYAAQRQVEIIPEIEMPGHSNEVFAAFPQLSCSGKKEPVPVGWGGRPFCAGNDSVFVFLQNVLDEVVELFPSKYIHIGGDEVDKKFWKKCPKCQNRIKTEKLKDENGLQSWFIKKMEKYLLSKGKRLIGWDEILEGGLAPEATVMSWRGVQGGIESAEQGHDAIMCPGTHCYFDHYQADPDFEPEAIGGFTTLKKVYSFNPVPEELSDDKKHFILGGQGNVWTEFIFTPEHAEYMAVPRMCALAEVLWTPESKRDWNDFRKRLETQFKRFDIMGVNYSKGSFKIDIIPAKEDSGGFTITFDYEQLLPVHYTLDGSGPVPSSPVYTKPLKIDTTTTIKAAFFKDGKVIRKVSERVISMHKATGKKITLKEPPAKRYSGQGPISLVDGLGGSDNFRDGYWLGFQGKDMEAEIDLGTEMPVNTVSEAFLQTSGAWIFLPEKVSFELLDDSRNIVASKSVNVKTDIKTDKTVKETFIADFDNAKARYVKVHVYALKKCPDWHTYAGRRSWIFTDEIVVD